MSRALRRRRRDLDLTPESDVVRVPGGFAIESDSPSIVAAPGAGPQPSGWVVVEHDAREPFTLLFDQGRGRERPGRAAVLPATNGRGYHLIGLPESSLPLRIAPDPARARFPLTRLTVHELGTWPLFFFLLDWLRQEEGIGPSIGELGRALFDRRRGPGAVLIEARLDRQRRLAREAGLGWEDEPLAPEAIARIDPASAGRRDARQRVAHRIRTRRQLEAFLAAGEPLVFPRVAAPDVSVIVVVHDQADLTLACLRSIARQQGPTVEVLVFDNASTDDTGRMLELVEGVTVLRGDENLGFVEPVNAAARRASGRNLLLLNNDAEPDPGALQAALETLEAATDVGAVGGRIVLLDGSLQEAGSMVWRDGSCWGYGRDGDPDAGPYRFRRDVDFCSGVFLLIRTELWRKLDGFDPAFAPAYYEEVDFCLRARAAGWRVVYEPGARVRHYEFATAGGGRAIELQLRNRALLVERHAESLATRLEPLAANVLAARTAGSRGRRILVIDDMVPHPFEGNGCPRLRAMLDLLLEQDVEVTFYPAQFPFEEWPVVERAVPPAVEVILRRGMPELEAFLEQRRGFYRALMVSRPHNLEQLETLRRRRPELLAGVRLIYDAEALFAMRDLALAELHGDLAGRAKAERALQAEVELARGADRVCAVSARERDLFARHGLDGVEVVPHAVEPAPTPAPFAARRGFLCVGPLRPETTPNVDGLTWMIDQVLPRLRERLPDCELIVAGRNENRALAGRRDPGLRFLGAIDDLRATYDGARVFVAPTRFSAGVPLKVLEAAAHGLPVVATDLLAEQLRWRSDEDLLASPVGDAAAFVDHCIRLYQDEELWRRLRAAALERVRLECDPRAARATLERLLEGV